MFLKRMLPAKFGPPPKLSEREYARRTVWLWCYLIVWLAVLVFLYIKWFELPLLLKMVLGVTEFVLTPDVSVVKRLFQKQKPEQVS